MILSDVHFLDFSLFLLPLLYAEMHHTLFGFSLVKRAMPEIISDAPSRVEPGQPIPLLILVKDAHHYPIFLQPIEVQLTYPNGNTKNLTFLDNEMLIDSPEWHHIFGIHPQKGFSGRLKINVTFQCRRITKPGKQLTFNIDNYAGLSKKPLSVFVAKEAHPRFKDYYFGDLHTHSFLTRDQVEFGAPIEVTTKITRAMGLSFFAVTDHSYDLDDYPDNYLQRDPKLSKWKQLHQMTDQDKNGCCICIPGEEVTCQNAKGRNIHLLLFNNKEFIPGSGDSFEKWFHTKSEFTLHEILQKIFKEENALAFAAHPEDRFHWIQQILIRRDKWSRHDYKTKGLNGLQILNGKDDKPFRRGLQSWVQQLLNGQKLFIIAGTDAHGNFNRFRQLWLPFLAFIESDIHLFGWAKTAVIVKGKLTRNSVLKALRNGACVITTGTVLNLEITNNKGEKVSFGQTLTGTSFQLQIQGQSSDEFGKFKNCKIWIGDPERKVEKLLVSRTHFQNSFHYEESIPLDQCPSSFYIRGELNTAKNTFCFTNPIWLQLTD